MFTPITDMYQVTFRPEIVEALKLTPGTQLEWSIGPKKTLVARPLSTKAQRAAALMGSGRKYLLPGADPMSDLIAERES